MGRYAQSIYANADTKFMVGMFNNFVGQTGYTGNFANDASQLMFPPPPTISTNNNTRFGYRQPMRADGITPYWFLQGTGDASTEQAIVTEQIDMLADAGAYGVLLFYTPQPAHIVSSPTATPPRDPWSQCIWKWYTYYSTSTSKSRLKFALILVSGTCSYDVNTGNANQEYVSAGTYLNLASFSTYWATLFQDTQYAKDSSGKPFVYLYDSLDSWTTTNRDVITTAATTAGLPGVHYIQANQNETQASTLSCDLGGYNNGLGVGTQNAYLDQITKDRSYWKQGAALRDKHVAMAHMNDGRVARGPGSWWTDHATYSQAELTLKQTIAFARASRKVRDQVVTLYSGGELCEAGEFFPTRQTVLRGVNTPSRGPWLDALKNVMTNTYPSTYVDCYHAMDVHADITRVGGAHWTTANFVSNGGGSATAAYKFQEHLNTTNGDTITIAPALPCTRIRVYGRLGAVSGCGTSTWTTDGGGGTAVNQAAGADTFNSLLYDTGVLSLAAHSVVGTVGTGMRLDEFKVSISR